MSGDAPAVVGFVATSGMGKTTLIERLVPLLSARGLRIGYLKHAHCRFDLDRPGKDSHRIRAAGARQTLIASGERWALLVEQPRQGRDPSLPELLSRFVWDELDLILVEGFKHARYPKIEVYRATLGRPPLYQSDPDIVAVVAEGSLPEGHPPRIEIGDLTGLAVFIEARLSSWPAWACVNAEAEGAS
ncbi:molybdopterin-guanine dinucleotide biosynthesis protein B [Thioalkalicoccus limnaeus]|uniref:Molybdopterin-guanine dinucleotide biosynthesis protein B n=1 Tax=Thioalkalicoccus limnaeus TaxID=120681 RepID=A0ABV4BEL9_9GAMM